MSAKTKRRVKYYTLLNLDMTSPYDDRTKYKIGEVKRIRYRREPDSWDTRMHLAKGLKNVNSLNIGPRVFEAEPVGDFEELDDVIRCKATRILKEMKEPWKVKVSRFALIYCTTLVARKLT